MHGGHRLTKERRTLRYLKAGRGVDLFDLGFLHLIFQQKNVSVTKTLDLPVPKKGANTQRHLDRPILEALLTTAAAVS